MKRIPNLKALEALETAVRCGSLKAAAQELGVSPAAVGQLVRKLEEDLGRSLLFRGANGFEPTESTRKACAALRRGFDDVARGKTLLGHDTGQKRLYVSVTPSISSLLARTRKSGLLLGHHAEYFLCALATMLGSPGVI